MYRRFIATIAAASLAITAMGAIPAYAGDRDTARALAAILGVAIVGKVIHDNNKKKRAYQQPAPVRHPPRATAPRHNPPRYNHPQPRPLPRHVNRKLLPQECFRSFETRQGKIRMFGERCLQQNFRHANQLPQHCHYKFGTPDGLRSGYEARCLRDAGYSLARG
jgi:hypothetical protein